MSVRSRSRVGRFVRQLGLARLVITALLLILALLIARFSWQLPLFGNFERALYDIRTLLVAPRVEQDPRIVMVVYNDETLAATAKRSPLDRTILARALANLDALQPKAIGIDILIDQAQPEDEELVAAFRSMRTPTFLAFASHRSNAANIQGWQEQFLATFQQRIDTPAVAPASVLFLTDADGAMRSWPHQPDFLPPLLSNAMTGTSPSYERAIEYRLPKNTERPVFAKFPIDLLADPAVAPALAEQIRGKYILIGGDIIDQDQFLTPMTWYIRGDPRLEDRPRNGQTIGLEVHAHMLAQLLDGRWKHGLPRWAQWATAVLVIVAATLSALSTVRPLAVVALMSGQLALFLLLPVGLEAMGRDTQTVPVFGWAVGWIVAFAAVGSAARALGSAQRKFAQSALGKYLPPDIAVEIMRNPDSLSLEGEKRAIFVVFTDLEGFTKLSHAIEPEMVASLLNRYLDLLSEVVLSEGGTIDKFVGDAVVAFWGAPIARPDDGQRALKAAIGMYQAGERFRREAPEGVPPIGCTRVGIHYGEAIVGNFGGEGRIQYTALGDAMNAAARLESANKQLGSTVLASDALVAQVGEEGFRPLGRVCLRGRDTPLEVFEPVPHLSDEERRSFAEWVRGAQRGDPQAFVQLHGYRDAHPEDAAIGKLLYRLEHQEEGGFYVLD